MTDDPERSDWKPLTSATTAPPRRGLGLRVGVVVTMLAGVVLLALVVQNGRSAELHLFWMTARVSLSALIIGAALVAVILDEVLGVIWRRRRRRLLDLQDRVG